MRTYMVAIQQKTPPLIDQSPDHIPVRILEVELAEPLPTITAFDEKNGKRYQRARCLVRLHTQPLGLVDLEIEKEELSPDKYAPKIWQELKQQINEHLQQDSLPPIIEITAEGLPYSNPPHCVDERDKFLADAPFVSVIVPTHDRPDRLALCLDSLLSLHYPQYEIIVVDNAPSTNATADLVKQIILNEPKVRYVREDRPGPSWARNRAIMEARGEILAFADDDVVVDPYWLVGLVRGFGVAENVACVTGLILPLELETQAQILFEEYGGFTRGFTQRIFDLAEHRLKEHSYPYSAGKFGTGASMAFTAGFLHRVQGFDPALGGHGPARCGQDIALFLQVIVQGYQLVYAPASLLYHHHRPEYESLQKQIYNYGVGFTAYLTKSLLENPHLMLDFTSRIPYSVFLLLRSRLTKNRKRWSPYPKELIRLELRGMIYGPLAYLRSRKAMRNLHNYTIPLPR